MSSADDLDEREPPSPTGVSNAHLPARGPACVCVCAGILQLRDRSPTSLDTRASEKSIPVSEHVVQSQCQKQEESVGLLSLSQMHSPSVLQLFSWILLTSNVFTLVRAAQMEVMLVLACGLSLYFL